MIICLGILIRIPIVTDVNLLIDGDEAIIGLMANDWIQHGVIPTYFTGQQYGLSTLEACTAGVFFSIFGMHDWVLKLSSLVIWLIGVVFFYLALVQLKPQKTNLAFVVSLILVSAPTWLYWAMKSRGGYISAFAFSSLLLFLITHQTAIWSNARAVAIGACLALISQFQSLWLISMLPIFIFYIFQPKQMAKLKFVVVGFLGVLLNLALIKFKQPNIWNPNLLRFNNNLFEWLFNFPNVLIHQFSGTYYLGSLKETQLPAIVFSIIVMFTIVLTTSIYVQNSLKTRTWFNLNSFLLASIFANFFITLFLVPGARYVLPVLSVVLIFVFCIASSFKKTKAAIPLILLVSSIFSSVSNPFAKDSDIYKFETQLTKSSMTQLLNGLKKEDITNIFVMNGMGQYQIMFYGQGEINARYVLEKDRMQARIDAVAAAFNAKEKTAFVLLKPQDRQHFSESKMTHLTETVSLVINPTIEELKIFKFETTDLN